MSRSLTIVLSVCAVVVAGSALFLVYDRIAQREAVRKAAETYVEGVDSQAEAAKTEFEKAKAENAAKLAAITAKLEQSQEAAIIDSLAIIDKKLAAAQSDVERGMLKAEKVALEKKLANEKKLQGK